MEPNSPRGIDALGRCRLQSKDQVIPVSYTANAAAGKRNGLSRFVVDDLNVDGMRLLKELIQRPVNGGDRHDRHEGGTGAD
jgi:hypothetical protein